MIHFLIALADDGVTRLQAVGDQHTILDKLGDGNHHALRPPVAQNPDGVPGLLRLHTACGDYIAVYILVAH